MYRSRPLPHMLARGSKIGRVVHRMRDLRHTSWHSHDLKQYTLGRLSTTPGTFFSQPLNQSDGARRRTLFVGRGSFSLTRPNLLSSRSTCTQRF